MPKGYPGSQTCKNCGECLPVEYVYCPMCGELLFKFPRRKKELVQILNPVSKKYTLIDKSQGKILKHSRSNKPYKNVPVLSNRKEVGNDKA